MDGHRNRRWSGDQATVGVLVNRRISWALMVLIVASLAGSLKVSHDEHASSKCQTARYAAVVDNLTIGRAVSTQSDAAKSQVFAGMGLLAQRPDDTAADRAKVAAQYRALLAQYTKAQAEVDAYRKANPYPDLDAPCTHKAR